MVVPVPEIKIAIFARINTPGTTPVVPAVPELEELRLDMKLTGRHVRAAGLDRARVRPEYERKATLAPQIELPGSKQIW
jgi:hypothetical protein